MKYKVIAGDLAYDPARTPGMGWRELRLEPVNRIASGRAQGVSDLRKRWIVERTFGWLARYRQYNRDYEKRTEA
jgi:transposase